MLVVEEVALESFLLGESLPGTLAAQPLPSARDARWASVLSKSCAVAAGQMVSSSKELIAPLESPH